MTNDIYMTAIDAVVDVLFENDDLKKHQKHYESIGDKPYAERIDRAICDNMQRKMGMEEMLSMITGVDRGKIQSDVMDRYNHIELGLVIR